MVAVAVGHLAVGAVALVPPAWNGDEDGDYDGGLARVRSTLMPITEDYLTSR